VSDHSTTSEHGAHAADGHGDAQAVEHEKPSDWGWNAEFGVWASRAGWIVVILIGLMFVGITHYNRAGFLAQLLVIIGLVTALLWDRSRKRTAWRD